MGQIIKFVNSENESIEFSLSKPFLLKGIEGLSDVGATTKTYKGYNQDGEIYKNSLFEKRQIVIKFNLLSESPENLIRLRDKITRVFNPKLGIGNLYYYYQGIERVIKCVPDGSPVMQLISFKSDCSGEVVLLAHDPYWNDIDKSGEIISTWIGGWKFKFRLPFRFKQKGDSKKNIINQGHVETPIEIIFKGPALNPCIKNNKTNEFIKITRELTSDDILYITTEYGNKKVEIERNGIKNNAFNYIDLDYTFFKLKFGDNMIEYITDNDLEPQSVEIRYRNRYIAI